MFWCNSIDKKVSFNEIYNGHEEICFNLNYIKKFKIDYMFQYCNFNQEILTP